MGGTSSEEEAERKEKEAFGDQFYSLPKNVIMNMAIKNWNVKDKRQCPIFTKEMALKIGKDVGFLPICWNIDTDLYPVLRDDPKTAEILANEKYGFHLKLAEKYTILPPEEKPKVNETEAEKKTRKAEREKLKKNRRDPNEGVTSINDAVRNGNEVALQVLINSGVIVNVHHSIDWSPLHLAAQYGHTECVRRLLKSPYIQVNAKHWYWTPLHQAAYNGRDACLRLLLEVPGVEVNSRTGGELTPLHCAAERGDEACVDRLLQAPGVQVNAVDCGGRTPLDWAAFYGHEACLRRLLQAPGVDINVKDIWGRTPLLWAVRNEHEACVRILLQAPGVDINTIDNDGNTPLNAAKTLKIKTLIIKTLIQDKLKSKKTETNVSPRTAAARAAIARSEASSSKDPTTGGKPKENQMRKDCITYDGKKYVVHMGSKGGKYILVGAEKKKVYVK